MKRMMFLVFACLLLSTSTPAMASASSATSLIQTASAYKGTPYRYGGTTTAGFDCSGYTQFVFKKEGVSIPRDTKSQYASGKAISKSNLKTGDLVFFNTFGKGASHVGIYVGSSKFIHASTSRGVMVSSINDPAYWGSRYIGARRVNNFQAETTIASAPEVDYATRAEIAQILVEELNLSVPTDGPAFKDVTTSHPQYKVIAAAAEAGIFSGNSAGEFMPDDYLTRSQLAKVLVEAYDMPIIAGQTPFKDVAHSNWANNYINTLYKNGITSGYTDGTFGTNKKVTANEFKIFMSRLTK